MKHEIDAKIAIIDDYISKLDDVIDSGDSSCAKELQEEIIGVFRPEISRITDRLDNYGSFGTPVDFIHDARILKAKLVNYKSNLICGIHTGTSGNAAGINVSQTVNPNVYVSVDITLDNTVANVNHLSSEVLSDEEKEILNGKLAGISAEKEKEKRWEKIGSALKWIAEKGIEVGTVALPYIVKALGGPE